MTWIKQNYDRFILALLAAVLLACAGLLFNNVHNFNSVFDGLKGETSHNNTIPGVNMTALETERKMLTDPFAWKVRAEGKAGQERQLPVFISVPYIEQAEADGKGGFTYKLVDPYQGGTIHPPVTNEWLIENHQDMLATNVLSQDTDGDGFTTLDEFLGKTDPNKKEDHPPFYTKLFIKQFVRIPFRLLFAARNGNTCLINTIDLDEPTQFLKEGDLVKKTKFKLTKLTVKQGKEDGIMKDLSEVTLTNTETNETIVLPKEKEVDSPTTYAVLSYVWNSGEVGAKNEFGVKKNQEFTIRPDTNVKYKCIELSDAGVTVLKEDENKKIVLERLPKK